MNTREEARERGGEEAVALFDRAKAIENKFIDAINAMVDGALGAATSKEDKECAFAGLCEALSEVYARTVAKFSDHNKIERGEALVMSVRSVAGNLNEAFDTIEAEKAGIGELILNIAKSRKGDDE